MKMKKVEIEIPEDMEIHMVRDHAIQYGNNGDKHDLVVELVKRQPRKWVFEEIVEATSVVDGGYYITARGEVFISCGVFDLCHDQIALRLVKE